ncbi:hypothetical protein PU088_000607 [Citrobacter farmeri]|uniref:Uncharacterized protein n=1 Tax=Citrobacter amalonaticus Y19 TaxID=1261127 RepID=A0A0F6RG99_CITAM|nr:hypothetical protein [Citrobacter amalonaticus]AKE60110.1 hypothetical protein F384_16900 [Citrobacter amalonaticus Y19]EKV5653179.1 hypothetical protein [Citrobacter farmeri]
MKKLALLLVVLSLPLTTLAANNASDLATQCTKSGKATEYIADATLDKYVSSVIYDGATINSNVNVRINNTYYMTVLSEHDQWSSYQGDGTDIAKVAFTAYTLGKKVSACVDNSTGFLYGLSF